MTYIIFDLETTGLKAENGDKVLQFAAQVWNDNECIRKVDFLINNHCAIPEFITNLTGITEKMVNDNGIEIDEAYEIIEDLFDNSCVIMGYNSDRFDIPFLMEYFRQNGYSIDLSHRKTIDVMKMVFARVPNNILPDKIGKDGLSTGKKSHTLSDVCKSICKDYNLSFHEAQDDVEATRLVYEEIVKRF